MASNLKVIEPELPRSRVNLAAAIEQRKASLEKFKAANAAAERLRGLIVEETNAAAVLSDLERQSAEGAAAWARGETETLRVPENDELDIAKRKLEHARRLADAARAAMPGVIQQRDSAIKELEAQQSLVADAVRQVLVDELVPTIAAERVGHLKRAAEWRATLSPWASLLRSRTLAHRQTPALLLIPRLCGTHCSRKSRKPAPRRK